MPDLEESAPKLVTNLQNLSDNIEHLEKIRLGRTSPDYSEYLEFVKRGTCFIPYQTKQGTAFAPSRFLGYEANNFRRHRANLNKHGKNTNEAISRLLRHEPETDEQLEKHYKRFCAELNIEVQPTGAFGHQRKYWRPLDGWTQQDNCRAKPEIQRFEVGNAYTREDVADLIGLDDKQRKGAWLTGYSCVNGEYYLFANVGASGRTGHNCPSSGILGQMAL